MDGWRLCARLFTHPGDFSSVKFCTDSTKVHQMRLKTEVPQVYTYMHTKRITHARYRSSGLCQSWVDYWKRQNNPAYTKSAGVFIILKLDTLQKRKRKMTVASFRIKWISACGANQSLLCSRLCVSEVWAFHGLPQKDLNLCIIPGWAGHDPLHVVLQKQQQWLQQPDCAWISYRPLLW